MKKIYLLVATVIAGAGLTFANNNSLVATTKNGKTAPAGEVKTTKTTVKQTASRSSMAVLLDESFEGATFPPTGWTSFDADGDGQDWLQFNNTANAHSGDNSAQSASWNSSPLTPENLLITPAITLAGGEKLEFWVGGQDPAWSAEHYDVLVSTAGNTYSDIVAGTTIHSETLANPGDWKLVSIDLSTYTGQTIYIAFIHQNVTDQFRIKLDDVKVFAPQAEDIGVLEADVAYGCGLTSTEDVTIWVKNFGTTAVSNFGVAYEIWTQAGNQSTINENVASTLNPGDTLTYVFTAKADLSAADTYQIITYATFAGDGDLTNDTATVLTEKVDPVFVGTGITQDFESLATGGFSGWAIDDANNDGRTWELFDNTASGGTIEAIYQYSSVNDANDYLFSSCIELSADSMYQLDFDYHANYFGTTIYPENLRAKIGMVQTPAGMTASIVDIPSISDTDYVSSSTPFTVSSSGVYFIGFQAYSTPDQYNLFLDNILISNLGPLTSVKENTAKSISVYPNPANDRLNIVLNGQEANVSVYDVTGKVISSEKMIGNSTMHLSSFSAGTYFVKVQTAEKVYNEKIVIKK